MTWYKVQQMTFSNMCLAVPTSPNLWVLSRSAQAVPEPISIDGSGMIGTIAASAAPSR